MKYKLFLYLILLIGCTNSKSASIGCESITKILCLNLWQDFQNTGELRDDYVFLTMFDDLSETEEKNLVIQYINLKDLPSEIKSIGGINSTKIYQTNYNQDFVFTSNNLSNFKYDAVPAIYSIKKGNVKNIHEIKMVYYYRPGSPPEESFNGLIDSFSVDCPINN